MVAPGARTGQGIGDTFPVGYYSLHPDVSLNFQMNRFSSWVGDDSMLAEMRAVVPRIHDYADFKREFLTLAERALADGQRLKGAYYLRAAEFFMLPDEAAKRPAREQFLRLMWEHYGVAETDHFSIPYERGTLFAYRFCPARAKGTIVIFGGFDSYIEEWFAMLFALRDAGYAVIAFEGPGQGAVLEDARIPMTHEWEKPIKAVLDFFHLDDVTLIGLSLGGELSLRAAAYERRVRRVVADDAMTDMFECALRQVKPAARMVLKALLAIGAARAVNALVMSAMKRSLVARWGITQGMHVTGSQTPDAFLRKMRRYRTAAISPRVTQHVLLMAGAEDHYVPLHQFSDQIRTLRNARSVTARLFTRHEQAQNHCQIGNIGLSLHVIDDWIDQVSQA